MIELVSIGVKPQVKHPYFQSSDDVFHEIDVDEDAILTFQELLEYLSKQRILGRQGAIFEREDINQDGVISWDEFTGPKKPLIRKNPVKVTAKSNEPDSGVKLEEVEVKINGKTVKVTDADIGWN